MGKTHDWQTEPKIVEAIIALCKANGITAIWEIGTFQGKTALQFKKAGFKVVTSDNQSHIQEEEKVKGIHYLIGDAKDIALNVAELLKEYKVAVFIDADHSYKAVSSDFKAVETAGLSNLVFFHDAEHFDIGCSGINIFLKAQLKNAHYLTIIIPTFDNTGIGIMRRL